MMVLAGGEKMAVGAVRYITAKCMQQYLGPGIQQASSATIMKVGLEPIWYLVWEDNPGCEACYSFSRGEAAAVGS